MNIQAEEDKVEPVRPTAGGKGLREQTFRGVVVLTGTAVAMRVLSTGSGIVLARLLDPVQFGLVSLCYIVLNVVSLLAPLGLGAALIKRQTDLERAPFQVFVANNVTAVFFFLAVLTALDPLVDLLKNQEVRTILPWMALLILLDGVGRVPEALIEKDLQFGTKSRISIIGEFVHIGLAISLALLGFGVWALVYAHLARSVSDTTLAVLWYRGRDWYRPRPWDWRLMKELLRFGMPMVGSRATYLFYLNADNFIVGRMLGATALGYYTKAFSFTSSTVDSLNKSVAPVLFPSYARIADDAKRLSSAYLRSLRMLGTGTIPLAMALFVVAPILVPSLLGQKWVPMVPILQTLALMSVVKPMSATTASVFNALGRPGKNMVAGIVVSVVMIGCIFPLLPFGTVGVAWAVVIAHIVGFAFNLYQMFRVLPDAARGMLRALAPPFAGALLTAAAIFVTRELLPAPTGELRGILTLLVMAVVGVVIYGSFLYLFQRDTLVEVRDLFRSLRRR